MTGGVAVRQALPADAAAIGAVHVQCWRESYTGLLPDTEIRRWTADGRTRMWRRAIIDGTARGIYVAELGERIIGFGACADQRAPDLHARGFTGEVTALYVLRASQRHGAGRRLMAAMARRLIAEGDRAMALWVLAGNDSACGFYEAMGGRDVGRALDKDLAREEIAYGWTDLAALAALGR